MAKKIKTNVVSSLGSELIETINKKFHNSLDKSAYFLSDPDVASDVTTWVSTGSDMLDLAISNIPNGGLPVGRISEITGLEASGKSLLAAYALRSTQKMGGLAIYIDTESAVSRKYLEAIGIDIDRLIYIQEEVIENIFAVIEDIITKSRQSAEYKDVLITIVVDSVMGATTKDELSADYDKDGYATQKAIIISKALRKLTTMIAKQKICLIFTNQLRVRMGVTFGDQYSTSGGKAIAFHSSVRLRLKSLGQIKTKVRGVDRIVGIKTAVVVQKNRLGPPLKSVEYDIYFDSGIDNYGSWLNTMNTLGLIKSGNFWTLLLKYTSSKYKDENGALNIIEFSEDIINPETGEIKKIADNELKFRSKDFATWMEANPKLKDWIYDMICDYSIVDYKVNTDFGIDDIQVDDAVVGEHD